LAVEYSYSKLQKTLHHFPRSFNRFQQLGSQYFPGDLTWWIITVAINLSDHNNCVVQLSVPKSQLFYIWPLIGQALDQSRPWYARSSMFTRVNANLNVKYKLTPIFFSLIGCHVSLFNEEQILKMAFCFWCIWKVLHDDLPWPNMAVLRDYRRHSCNTFVYISMYITVHTLNYEKNIKKISIYPRF
jgi:hypothetical protein